MPKPPPKPPEPVPCRMCGKPGHLYLSGRWCDECYPFPKNPDPPKEDPT